MNHSVEIALDELPLTCAHWGTYRVETSGNRVVNLHPFEHDPDPSPIGRGIVGLLDHPLRVKSPAIRKSWLDSGPGSKTEARGTDPFVKVSWKEAEELVATELNRVRSEFGNQAIYAGSYGWASAGRFHHAQSQLKRFLNCIGGFTSSVNSYSLAAAEAVMPHILGPFHKLVDESTSWESIARHTELLVAFGGVPLRNSQINAGGLGNHCQRDGVLAARLNSCEFVSVSPIKADFHEGVDAQWLPIIPGTDVALLLAIAHTLYTENLYDENFVRRYTAGFEAFIPYLTGETDGVPKTADWASRISSIPASEIEGLARRMASKRTMISVSWSLSRQSHGEQPYWAAITVAAMLGQFGLPGGGVGFGYGAVNTVGDHFTIVPAASFPRLRNPVKDFIPVARISDMLCNPGGPFEYDGHRYVYPDIRIVYWAGGNPFHHHQDLFRLERAWRRPETIIVHDWTWNPLAKRADIILPCTTPLERNDIAISRNPYLIYMKRAVQAPPECRNDHDIFAGIAARMGVREAFTGGLDDAGWIRWMYDETRRRMTVRGVELPEFEELRKNGWHRVEPPREHRIFLGNFRRDPVGHPLATPSGKIEIYSESVVDFGYADCPGYAAWLEPAEWLGGASTDYPLHLISSQPPAKLHSQLDHGGPSMASKIDGREAVTLNPSDAAQREIQQGDIVRVFSDRGGCLAFAVISDEIRSGVIQMSTGAWFDPVKDPHVGWLCSHGNPNAVTLDKGTSRLGQGPIAHSCLVEIERFTGDLLPVRAHLPPELEERSSSIEESEPVPG